MDEQLLAWFRDEVATPIVASILAPNELDSMVVEIAPRPPRPPGLLRLEKLRGWRPPGDDYYEPRVWVDVTAGQGAERFRKDVLSEAELHDVALVRARVAQWASDLEDWVCETRFAWGQQRVAQVPDVNLPDL